MLTNKNVILGIKTLTLEKCRTRKFCDKQTTEVIKNNEKEKKNAVRAAGRMCEIMLEK